MSKKKKSDRLPPKEDAADPGRANNHEAEPCSSEDFCHILEDVCEDISFEETEEDTSPPQQMVDSRLAMNADAEQQHRLRLITGEISVGASDEGNASVTIWPHQVTAKDLDRYLAGKFSPKESREFVSEFAGSPFAFARLQRMLRAHLRFRRDLENDEKNVEPEMGEKMNPAKKPNIARFKVVGTGVGPPRSLRAIFPAGEGKREGQLKAASTKSTFLGQSNIPSGDAELQKLAADTSQPNRRRRQIIADHPEQGRQVVVEEVEGGLKIVACALNRADARTVVQWSVGRESGEIPLNQVEDFFRGESRVLSISFKEAVTGLSVKWPLT